MILSEHNSWLACRVIMMSINNIFAVLNYVDIEECKKESKTSHVLMVWSSKAIRLIIDNILSNQYTSGRLPSITGDIRPRG